MFLNGLAAAFFALALLLGGLFSSTLGIALGGAS